MIHKALTEAEQKAMDEAMEKTIVGAMTKLRGELKVMMEPILTEVETKLVMPMAAMLTKITAAQTEREKAREAEVRKATAMVTRALLANNRALLMMQKAGAETALPTPVLRLILVAAAQARVSILMEPEK